MKCPNCKVLLVKSGNAMQCPQCPFNLMHNDKVLSNLYAWVSIDPENGYEGMIASMMPNGVAMALLSSNLETVTKLKTFAENAVATVGMTTKLVKFKRVGFVE